MAHNPEWHRQYADLEVARNDASAAYRSALKAHNRKSTPARAAALETALTALRAANKARFEFEMAATTIVDVATLDTKAWATAMLPNRGA